MTVLVTGHARPDVDSCISVIAVAEFLQKRGIEAIPVIAGKLTPEAAYLLARFRLAGPEEIASTAGHKVVLVDFASRVCAPAGIEKADIIGIIDHHEPGDLLPPETQKAVLHLVRSACSLRARWPE